MLGFLVRNGASASLKAAPADIIPATIVDLTGSIGDWAEMPPFTLA
ncbi:MAG: hypothetical protein ACOYM3_01705 [Terrimicrobiaceae bacterium]